MIVIPLSHNEQLIYISMFVDEYCHWYGVHIKDFVNTLPICITTWCNMYVFHFSRSFIFTSHCLLQVDSAMPTIFFISMKYGASPQKPKQINKWSYTLHSISISKNINVFKSLGIQIVCCIFNKGTAKRSIPIAK